MQNFRKNEVNIMCKRVYLKAKDAEKEMQEARKADGFIGKTVKRNTKVKAI